MAALATSAAASEQQGAASPLSQSQRPPSSFTDLRNHTQAPAAAAAAAAMHSQSLTQHLSPPATTTATKQFCDAQAVQQRLTAACTKYSEATAALQKAIEGRDRFVNSGSKNGGSKQLPAKLDWKLSKAAHLSSDAVPANFYASDQKTLRAIEREATEKAFDALLAAKDKHIAFLRQSSILRDFVDTTAQQFQPELQRMAADFNASSQADTNMLSQADFAFPLDAVAAYFRDELIRRLSAQTLAAVEAKQREEQRVAQQRTEEHKSQELVLAGAHTGETISMLAHKEVREQLAPVLQQLEAIRKQLPSHAPSQPPRQPPHTNQHRRHRAPTSDASSSQFRQAPHHRNAIEPPSRLVVVRKNAAPKRPRDVEAEDDAIEQNPPASSHEHQQRGANKRHKLTVTFKPKNGEGGDRPSRSDQQQPRSSRPATAPHQHNSRKQGRGPRSDAQQTQPLQPSL